MGINASRYDSNSGSAAAVPQITHLLSLIDRGSVGFEPISSHKHNSSSHRNRSSMPRNERGTTLMVAAAQLNANAFNWIVSRIITTPRQRRGLPCRIVAAGSDWS
jgi:hypothetical protein